MIIIIDIHFHIKWHKIMKRESFARFEGTKYNVEGDIEMCTSESSEAFCLDSTTHYTNINKYILYR